MEPTAMEIVKIGSAKNKPRLNFKDQEKSREIKILI